MYYLILVIGSLKLEYKRWAHPDSSRDTKCLSCEG